MQNLVGMLHFSRGYLIATERHEMTRKELLDIQRGERETLAVRYREAYYAAKGRHRSELAAMGLAARQADPDAYHALKARHARELAELRSWHTTERLQLSYAHTEAQAALSSSPEGAAEREWAKRRKGYRDSHWGGAALTDAEVDAKLRENDAFWGRSTTPKPKG